MILINVLVVTYKQEHVIGRTIESILLQKDYGLNEIVICDDCSPDNTWGVIQEYVKKYPGLIRAYRNNPNLGIYDNEQKLLSLRGEADFYTELAGDDILCKGWFEELQTFLSTKEFCVTTPFAVYSDWKIIPPSGEERVFSQSIVVSGESLVSLALRGLISPRSVVMSKGLVDSFTPVDTSHGLPTAEMRYDLQIPYFSQFAFYCKYVGSAYYSEVGISTTTHSLEYDILRLYNYCTIRNVFYFDKKDSYLIDSRIYSIKYVLSHSIFSFCASFFYYVKSIKKTCSPAFTQILRTYGSLFLKGFKKSK